MGMKTCYGLLLVMGAILLALLSACQTIDHDQKKDAAVVAPPPVERPKYIFHRIMEGETMGSIGKWYSGSEALWYELKEENPGMDPFNPFLKDLGLLRIGRAGRDDHKHHRTDNQ
jgi:hypothetical protein